MKYMYFILKSLIDLKFIGCELVYMDVHCR